MATINERTLILIGQMQRMHIALNSQRLEMERKGRKGKSSEYINNLYLCKKLHTLMAVVFYVGRYSIVDDDGNKVYNFLANSYTDFEINKLIDDIRMRFKLDLIPYLPNAIINQNILVPTLSSTSGGQLPDGGFAGYIPVKQSDLSVLWEPFPIEFIGREFT